MSRLQVRKYLRPQALPPGDLATRSWRSSRLTNDPPGDAALVGDLAARLRATFEQWRSEVTR